MSSNNTPPAVKICCIQSIVEAQLALSAGASALGLVARMPSGPGPISDEAIAEIVAALPTETDTFLLTSETEADAIIAHHARCPTRTLQLVDAVSHADLQRIRAALPFTRLVQVIHVVGPESLIEALEVAPLVDALLLDSGNPSAAVKELGGTGRVHDWSVSQSIVAQSGVPVWLAGGLNPSNVREAIETVQPHGLDLCSSVRTNGVLDSAKLTAFFEAVNS
ncbi:MAG: phosphoribosylanthranilate isomerase [Armatimonas sp.]